jgi:hypothetical protein
MRNRSHDALNLPANALSPASNMLYVLVSKVDVVASCQRKWFLSKLLNAVDVVPGLLLCGVTYAMGLR